jgi:hypothetical protein
MREGQKLWTREELFLAVNLYCKLPFGKLDRNTKEVKDLAALIGRTANSVALKLVNFSSLDPAVVSRGIKGMGNASRLDNEVWDVFCNDWSGALSDSEKLLADIKITTVERLNNVDVDDLLLEGKERQQLINSSGKPSPCRTDLSRVKNCSKHTTIVSYLNGYYAKINARKSSTKRLTLLRGYSSGVKGIAACA